MALLSDSITSSKLHFYGWQQPWPMGHTSSHHTPGAKHHHQRKPWLRAFSPRPWPLHTTASRANTATSRHIPNSSHAHQLVYLFARPRASPTQAQQHKSPFVQHHLRNSTYVFFPVNSTCRSLKASYTGMHHVVTRRIRATLWVNGHDTVVSVDRQKPAFVEAHVAAPLILQKLSCYGLNRPDSTRPIFIFYPRARVHWQYSFSKGGAPCGGPVDEENRTRQHFNGVHTARINQFLPSTPGAKSFLYSKPSQYCAHPFMHFCTV